MFKSLFEPPEAEVARLAACPVGSRAHRLSQLPVNITGPLGDLLIELPRESKDGHTIVVVPFQRLAGEAHVPDKPFRRNNGSWHCIVVASNHPSYPVGGNRINVSESELVRGTLRTLEVPETPSLRDALA